MNVVPLLCHPASPNPHVRQLTAGVDASERGLLKLRYELTGNLDQLQLPAPAQPDRTDGLWKHTCFEAFLRAPQASAYVELNFSPSSQWAIYRFDDYRQGMSPIATARAPTIVCRRRDDTVEVDVDVRLDGLQVAGQTRLALCAVVQDRQGANSYWALAHAPDKPDFHHAAGFALTVTIPDGEA